MYRWGWWDPHSTKQPFSCILSKKRKKLNGRLGPWPIPPLPLQYQSCVRGPLEQTPERRQLTEWVCACSFSLGEAAKTTTCNK